MLHAVWTALIFAVAPPPGADELPTAPPASCLLVRMPENQDHTASSAVTPGIKAAATKDKDGGGASAVPEPSTLLLVGTGLLGLAITRRWRRSPR